MVAFALLVMWCEILVQIRPLFPRSWSLSQRIIYSTCRSVISLPLSRSLYAVYPMINLVAGSCTEHYSYLDSALLPKAL